MTDEELLAGLNEPQREAVTHVEGPLLVLAGPGSGKTRVITRRVVNLLHLGIHPGNILAITFTNKAAGEMKRRVEELVPGSRVWVSTFHSFGARILRQYADQIGLDRNFTIYDQTDRGRIMKMALENASLDPGRFTPDSAVGAVSKAKNNLLSPERYAQQAKDFYAKQVSRFYPIYEQLLRAANALDFDDLLYWPAMVLKNNADIRSELDARFRFVLIDEYQDTNQAQYEIARRLSVDHPNLCVVGDADQCIPPGTLVETSGGPRPIEDIREGDHVLSGCGYGDAAPMPVNQVMVSHFKGKLVTIRTQGGHVVRATPNHLCFARLMPTKDTHFVYLMWKKGVGYRLGTTRGVRTSSQGDILSGLQVRTNQEVADAIWLVKTCPTSAEARFYEHFLSVTYGIPTLVFHVRGRRMDMTQEWVDRMYREVDTEAGAARLMAAFHLDRRYPHHRPGGVTRGTWGRRNVLFTMFGDHRKSQMCAWHYHRVQMVTTGEEARVRASATFKTRPGTRGTWRIETSRKHHDEGLALANEVGGFLESEVTYRARLTEKSVFVFMPAAHINSGMAVPVFEGGRVVEKLVESVEWDDYEGPVYDLSVPETHNFIAGGVTVHNSIYRFRGSDIRNILNFERDFPHARVIKLNVNYRSTPNIIDAASRLIANNTQRKPLDLRTDNASGAKVSDVLYETGQEEAEGIARHIRDAVGAGRRAYRDFAILLRMNALTRGLELAFNQHRVPYQIVRGLAFYDRKEVRDLLAYLRLVANPNDSVSFERAIAVPSRGVGEKTLEAVIQYAHTNEMSLVGACNRAEFIPGLKPRQTKPLREFGELIRGLQELAEAAPDEIIRQALVRSGYEKMLKDSGEDEDAARLENVQELITAAHQLHQNENVHTLQMFLESVALTGDLDGWAEDKDCVSVMTLHASKGLEFPVVIMAAVEQGILPHERSLQKPEELEEERRLAFVGITRAKEEMMLTRARMREFRGQTLYTVPSLFLGEIPPHLMESIDRSSSASLRKPADTFRSGGPAAREAWEEIGLPPVAIPSPREGDNGLAVGAKVRHEQYGVGEVTELTGHGGTRTAKVRFPQYGIIAFRLQFAKLEIVA